MDGKTLEQTLSHLRDLLNAGRFDDAKSFVAQSEVSLSFDRGSIHCMRGSVFDCQGELHLAEAEYRKAAGFAESSLHPEALSRHANTLQRLNQLKEALQQAQKLVRLYPGYPDGLSLLGELLHNLGNHKLAVKFLEPAHRAAPTDRRVCWALIRSYHFTRCLVEGRALLNEVLGNAEEDWDLLLVLAGNLVDTRHYETALELYLRHLKMRPWTPEVVTGAIYAVLEVNQMAALESLARVLITRVESPDSMSQVFTELENASGHFENQHELLLALLKWTDTEDWAVQSFAASLALQLDCYQDAYRVAMIALQCRDDFDFMRSVAATAATQLQMYGEAVELIKTYLEKNEPEPGLMRVLGTCECNLGNFFEACAALEFCLDENPDDIESRSIYAVALHHLGRLQEAKQQYERCLAQEPNDLESQYCLMLLLDELGDIHGCKNIAQRLVSDGYKTDTQEFKDFLNDRQWQF
jgi:tetratricopeptide (TPR) repeat protein